MNPLLGEYGELGDVIGDSLALELPLLCVFLGLYFCVDENIHKSIALCLQSSNIHN